MADKHEGEARIDLRVPAAMKPELVERARAARQSLNSYLLTVLERELGLRP